MACRCCLGGDSGRRTVARQPCRLAVDCPRPDRPSVRATPRSGDRAGPRRGTARLRLSGPAGASL